MVGEIHAVMAVLLMAGVAVFSVPTPEFGPAILATPLWALLLFHYWRAAHHGDFVYWLAVGVEGGLLLLTTYGGLILIGLVVLFMLSSKVGRSHLESVGPWVAGLVTVSILFPYLVWLDLGGGTRLIGLAQVVQNLRMWGWMLAALLVGHLGLAILVVLGRGYIFPSRSKPPEVMREGVDPGARVFVYFFALAPVLAMGLFSLLSPRPENFMAAPLAAMSGLAVIVAAGDRIRIEHQYVIGYAWAALMILPPVLVALAVTVQPWIFAVDLRVGRPAKDIGQFFAESFQRRTGKPLEIVGGDLPIAALISLTAPTRPSLYLEVGGGISAEGHAPGDRGEGGGGGVGRDRHHRPPAGRNPSPVPRPGGGGAARIHAALPGAHAAASARLGHDPAAHAGRHARAAA